MLLDNHCALAATCSAAGVEFVSVYVVIACMSSQHMADSSAYERCVHAVAVGMALLATGSQHPIPSWLGLACRDVDEGSLWQCMPADLSQSMLLRVAEGECYGAWQ